MVVRNGSQPQGEPEKVKVHDFPDKELGQGCSPTRVFMIWSTIKGGSASASIMTLRAGLLPTVSNAGGVKWERNGFRAPSELLITAD